MKTLILIFAFCSGSLLCVGQTSANTTLVRVIETLTPTTVGFISIDSKIFVSPSNGETEILELSSKGVKNFAENTQKIQETLSKYFSNKYELVSELSSGGDMVNNYIWIFREVEVEPSN